MKIQTIHSKIAFDHKLVVAFDASKDKLDAIVLRPRLLTGQRSGRRSGFDGSQTRLRLATAGTLPIINPAIYGSKIRLLTEKVGWII